MDRESPLPPPLRLPDPRRSGGLSLLDAINSRHSSRTFQGVPVSLADLGQLLWCAQGLVAEGRHRTTPSAGQTYPLEVLVVAGAVNGLAPAVYRYVVCEHSLALVSEGDQRADLYAATMAQAEAADAPATIVLTAVYDRATGRYGTRGITYTLMEAGHAGQNLYLQATALGLGTVAVGAFREEVVRTVLNLNADEHPLYLFPVGRPLPSPG